MTQALFSWIDYTIFTIITGFGCAIGVYFGLYKKQDNAQSYVYGSKNLKWFPVSMSLVSSALTGASLLGYPTEVYLYGTQVSVLVLSIFVCGLINHVVFLPVFYKLQVSNVYEYLELRYNRILKNTFCLTFLITGVILLPLFMYIPSLIFSQVSGVDLHVIAPIMTLVCIFYTAVGGMKAVVWADTLQFAVTLITFSTVIVISVRSIGGLNIILDRLRQGDRLEFFNFNLDPTIRSSFWTVFIGYVFSWTGTITISAPEVQRFLSLSSKTNVLRVLIVFIGVTIGAKIICFFFGVIIYGKYYNCDPYTIGLIKKPDQIVPFFITEITKGLIGLNGLFVAAFFGAAFSTFSTLLNTLASVLFTDFAHLFLPAKYVEEKPGVILKLFTFVIGISSIGTLYLIENVGTVFEVVHYIKGITGGAVLGIYLLGLLVPVANTKGAITGGLVSTIIMGVIIIRTQVYIWNGVIKHATRPLHTYGCNFTNSSVFTPNRTILSTLTASSDVAQEQPVWLFRISFQYYYCIGTMITILVGVFVSCCTRKDTDEEVNPDCISPFVNKIRFKWRRKTTEFNKEAEPLQEKTIA